METISHTHNPARTLQRVVPGQEPWRDANPDAQMEDPVEGDYAAPATPPTVDAIRESLEDATAKVKDLSGRLSKARQALALNQHVPGTANMSAEISERARADVWAATFPEFKQTEHEIEAELRRVLDSVSAQRVHVEELSRIETIPTEAYQAAHNALPFVQGEIEGMTGSVLVSRLQAVATLSDPGQVLAWRLAARGWAKAHASDQQVREVRRLADDLGSIFRTSDPGADIRVAQRRASEAAQALQREIRDAQNKRGDGLSSPDRWGLGVSTTMTERRSGYEKE